MRLGKQGRRRYDSESAYIAAAQPRVGRPGISSLERPARKFRPRSLLLDFETKAACVEEDAFRIRSLLRTKHEGEWGRRAIDLAHRLNSGTMSHPWPTMASKLYFRDLREKLVGNVAQLLSESPPEILSFFTIVRQDWAFHPADLPNADLHQIRRRFRKNIDDLMGRTQAGWLIAAFDSSYDPIANCHQGHFHGVAADSYVDAIDNLKGRKPYKPWSGVTGIPDCAHPVENPLVTIEGAIRSFAYSLKGYWELRNAGRAKRLQGDEHTRMLLFLDERRPQDLIISINLGVSGGSFKINRTKQCIN